MCFLAGCVGWRRCLFLQIVSILVDALTLSETPAHKKVARLYLVSDILHNAATRRGSTVFRAQLQTALPAVFASMHALYVNTAGRLAAEAYKVSADTASNDSNDSDSNDSDSHSHSHSRMTRMTGALTD